MNFALLGGHDSLLPLLRAIADDPQHKLSIAAAVPVEFSAEVLQIAPSARLVTEWQELLNATDIDAVIAVSGETHIDEGIRQLATTGTPIVLKPDGDPTSSLVYELTLVRDDNQVPLIPLFPMRDVPQLQKLKELIAASGPERVLSLQWNRTIAAAGNPPLLSRADVYESLLYDADLLRQLAGRYAQVTAVLSEADSGKVAMATVTLAGPKLPTATCTFRPGDRNAFDLGIVASDGTMRVSGELSPWDMPHGDSSPVSITLNNEPVDELQSNTPCDVPGALLKRIVQAGAKADGGDDWLDLTRAVEVVEAAGRSVRRRRTIDLHFETTSERNQFKTQMTAIGCMLMTMTLFSVVILLIVENALNVHPVVMNILWVGVFLPLGLFLLLQLLLFIARPSTAEERNGEGPSAEG